MKGTSSGSKLRHIYLATVGAHMHTRVLMLALCTLSSTAQAARCGPRHVPKGQTCCNESCGMLVETDSHAACVMLDCGWDRHRAGGSVGIMPASWLQPFSAFEVDATLRSGLTTEPFDGLVSLRIPASESLIFRTEMRRRGTLPGARKQQLAGELIWNVPLGTLRAQGALHAGLVAAQDATVDDVTSPYRAFAARQVNTPWRPRAYLGVSSVAGYSIFSLAATFRGTGRSFEGQPQLGFHGGLSAGMDLYWSHLATQVSVEVERPVGGERVYAGVPAGVYWSGLNSRVLLGAEARVGWSPGPRTGVGWQAGVRLRIHGDPSDLRGLRDLMTL